MISALLIAAVLGQAGSPSGGACAIQTTSRLDALLNPNSGADERFFSRPNGAPNVLFLVDTSVGTRAWLEEFPSGDGCPDGFPNGYDNTKAYEPVLKNVDATGWPGDDNHYHKEWFNFNKVYVVPSDANFGVNLKNDPVITPSPYSSVNNACAEATDVTGCEACMNTKGFYKGAFTVAPTSRRIATGNLLNYSPPRYVATMQTITQLVRDVSNIRFAVAVSGEWSNDDFTNSPDVPMSVLSPFWPSCSKTFKSLTERKFEDEPTSQRNSVISGIMNNPDADFSGANLTASMLYGAGWLFKSSSATPPAFPGSGWPSPSGGSNSWNEKDSNNQKSICDACVFSAVILINASSVDETESAFSSGNTPANGIPVFATEVSGAPAATCDGTVAGNKCDSRADELAAWLYQRDFRQDMGGIQRISTYVINLHDGSATGDLLRSVARQGGGRYFRAQSNAQLKAQILEALDDISNRGQTFATSAVTSIQTGSLNLTQLVPRMYPQRNLPWSGELYRYAQRNEFVENVNLNGDSDTTDVFAVDSAGSVVVESSDGFFKKAVSFADPTPSTTDAVPFWEAANRLRALGWANRRIWTVLDPNSDSNENFMFEDDHVAFTSANWEQLFFHLGLEPRNCPSGSGAGALLRALNLTIDAATTAVAASSNTAYNEICAKVVINYTRGQDLGDEDGDNDRTEARASMMADIFHSSPVVVDPPPEKFICDLGLSNQCARTLYADSLPAGATPLANGTYTDPLCEVSGSPHVWTDPYDIYRARNRARDRLVVVGSNGGMLHVFNNGQPSGATCSGIAWSATWNEGTGDEEFAFIPPDLMPKLQDQILNGHEYFVDGDVMIRDVWADGSGSTNADGFKQWDEFHTVLVGSEGRGGTHYFALELMWPSDTNTSINTSGTGTNRIRNPVNHSGFKPFRWMFPQPGSRQAAVMGKTLFTLNPKPPPIGPVLMKMPDAAPSCGGSPPGSGQCAVTRYGIKTREAWITMVAGGWSPGLERGRGVYMLDAFWGVINGREDNLYWEGELRHQGTITNPVHHMSASITAPVAMADYGANGDPKQDGFFDTAVVGDTIGQLWVARFFAPGVLDDDAEITNGAGTVTISSTKVPWVNTGSTPQIVENWRIARGFEMDKGSLSGDWKSSRFIQPFHYLTSLAIDPGTLSLRALVGTGNRQALLEPYSGVCRFDNPLACSKFGCDDMEIRYFAERAMPGFELADLETNWADQTVDVRSGERLGYGSESFDSCGFTSGYFDEYRISDCRQDSGGDKDYDHINESRVECYNRSLNGVNSYSCFQESEHSERITRDLSGFKIDESGSDGVDDGSTGQLGRDRYFGLWIYGGHPDRQFDETETDSTDPNSALSFDGRRLTDRSTDLVNVSGTSCVAAGTCSGSVVPTTGSLGKWGWFLDYDAQGVKTATGSAVVASCALWSTLRPGGAVVGGAQACVSSVASSGFYQADFLTGEPNCAAGFSDGTNYVRSMTRSVLTPPPEPATIVQVSTTGQIRYSAQLPEPGKGQQFQVDVTVPSDIVQSIYELPVSRSTHECRHTQNGDCSPVP